MKNSSKETPTTPQKEGLSVSPRKLAANRRNALKSTCPKTERGKAFSRRNSWKHGLFARQAMDFIAHGENPEEYLLLLEGFREQFRPSGYAEELEVERIAQSWWRLKRAYRYENAMNKVAQLGIARSQLMEYQRHLEALERQDKAIVQLLESSRDEILRAGQIPQEVKTKVLALVPAYQDLWADSEYLAERAMNRGVWSKTNAK